MKLIQQFINKSPQDKVWWILFALLIRGAIGIHLFVTQNEVYFNGIYDTTHSDAFLYLHSVENFLASGDYSPAHRMPGLGLLYFVLRLFLTVKQAINGIIIIQITTAAVSVYYLALTLFQITKNKAAFFFCYLLFLISPLCMAYEFHPMTESICTSLLIFYIYYIVQYHIFGKSKSLWIAGLCIGSAIFFRPVYLPLIALPFITVLIGSVSSIKDFPKLLKLFPVVLPFLLFDLLWINFNYQKQHKFIPLQPSMYVLQDNSIRLNLYDLLIAYGGDVVPWNDNAETNWFYNFNSIKTANSFEMENKFPFSNDLLNKTTTIDTFYRCKTLIHLYFDDTTGLNKDSINSQFAGLSKRMIGYLKKDYPFYFYVSKRLILLKKFVVNKGTYFLYPESFSELNLFQKAYKIIASLIYIGVMLLLPFGLLIVIWRSRKKIDHIYLWAPVIYTLTIFPLVLGFIEYKYISPAFPFMIAVSAVFLSYLFERFIGGRISHQGFVDSPKSDHTAN